MSDISSVIMVIACVLVAWVLGAALILIAASVLSARLSRVEEDMKTRKIPLFNQNNPNSQPSGAPEQPDSEDPLTFLRSRPWP